MRGPRTLTSRLVLTSVTLVAVVSLLIGAATALAMQAYLADRLDQDVRATLARTQGGPGPPDGQPLVDLRNQAPGTLIGVFGSSDSEARLVGSRPGDTVRLPDEARTELGRVPVDDQLHTVRLPGVGSYRVATRDLGEGLLLVVGLPTEEVTETIGSLVWREALLALLGVLAAALVSTYVVRRRLQPLREVAATAHRVAELPLGSGEVAVGERVPERLTDTGTEVGQVGAALNTLLDHVESALSARHRSEQQVRQFVADASHELRTPLATIRGYTELAERHPEDREAVARALAKVAVESGRMAGLVEDLLLLARLDAGRPLARERVDLTRLLLEAVSDARVLAPDHEWRLELPDEPIEVTGDEHRLHQVVSNLLANARRYTPAGTTVTVHGDAEGFTVHDDGPGFDQALLGSAFERFTRGDAARTREDAGAGLGLALVRAIVSAHGGAVRLESRPGDTSVRVELPLP